MADRGLWSLGDTDQQIKKTYNETFQPHGRLNEAAIWPPQTKIQLFLTCF